MEKEENQKSIQQVCQKTMHHTKKIIKTTKNTITPDLQWKGRTWKYPFSYSRNESMHHVHHHCSVTNMFLDPSRYQNYEEQPNHL